MSDTVTIDEQFLAQRIRSAFPDAEVEVEDMTGTRDHWQVRVASAAFAGLSRLQQHRRIYDLFREEMKGPLHALSLQTEIPA